MTILVTGGAGYIGSHTCIELINGGFDIVVVDNLCNSSKESILRVEKITGATIPFYELDIQNNKGLKKIFESHDIKAVLHFAGLKSVSESVSNPDKYHSNNVVGSENLFQVMSKFKCKNIIFSSSATVYGIPKYVPIDERSPLDAINPYGETKLMVENILCNLYANDKTWNIAMLRYFNPVGAHDSGLIGEDPNGTPNNLMPLIMRTASGKDPKIKIYGNDYETEDGSGVRDYIHVVDLAKAHVKALRFILEEESRILVVNLGTGHGVSVLKLINIFQSVSGKLVPFEIAERREGDVAISYANPALANKILDWRAEKSLEKMCEDAWRWQCMNPNGYQEN